MSSKHMVPTLDVKEIIKWIEYGGVAKGHHAKALVQLGFAESTVSFVDGKWM